MMIVRITPIGIGSLQEGNLLWLLPAADPRSLPVLGADRKHVVCAFSIAAVSVTELPEKRTSHVTFPVPLGFQRCVVACEVRTSEIQTLLSML
jgi:hypothetical protein